MGRLLEKVKHGDLIKALAGVASVIGLAVIIIFNPDTTLNIPRLFYFDAKYNDGVIEGTAFRFDQSTPQNYEIFLQNTKNGRKKELVLAYGIDRSNIQEYYSCDRDYTYSGFRGTAEVDSEYEFMIRYNPFLTIPSNVYISPAGIHYTTENSFFPPSINADFVKFGTLRVYRPDYHCWVYQHMNSLYWIVEPGFNFENDGTTYIQYQLWTTQVDRLPEKRLENNWLWDNIGGYFEKYELQGEFGQYRVMKREIPTDYAITSIVTGYYKNGLWIWKEYFRPYFQEISPLDDHLLCGY